jgi:hypothetical protein
MTKVERETKRETEIEREKAWALKMADLEEGYVVSAGYKTISDVVQILKFQEAARKEATQSEETTQPSSSKKPRVRVAKPVASK